MTEDEILRELMSHASEFLGEFALHFHAGAKLTLMVANPGYSNADLLITNDTIDNVIAVAQKLKDQQNVTHWQGDERLRPEDRH